MTQQTEVNQAIITPEHLSEPELYGFLNGIGNHEAKLLTAAIVTLHPDEAFSESRLASEVKMRQGNIPEWIPRSSVAFKYCVNSLEPIGAVVKSTVAGRYGPVAAYQATEFGSTRGPSFIGAQLDWGLEYPKVSSQKILGATSSSSELRSPQVRFLIYQDILTSPKEHISYVNIAESLNAYGIDKKVLDAQLRSMQDLGIIHIDSQLVEWNPTFRILSPDLHHPGYKLGDLQPTTQLFYRAMHNLYESGQKEVDMDTFLAACLAIDPSANQPRLRKIIAHGTNEKTSTLATNIEMIEKGVVEDQRTVVSLTDQYRPAIEDFCDRMQQIADGINLDHYEKRAREIIGNPVEFSALMAKAKRFSSAVKGQTEVLWRKVLAILPDDEPISTHTAVERLAEAGEKYDLETVRVALNGLVKSQEAVVATIAADPSKKTKINVYQRTSQST